MGDKLKIHNDKYNIDINYNELTQTIHFYYDNEEYTHVEPVWKYAKYEYLNFYINCCVEFFLDSLVQETELEKMFGKTQLSDEVKKWMEGN